MKKKILITGSNGGIGRAIAEKFAKDGKYDLLLHARAPQKSFLEYIERLEKQYSVLVTPTYFDVTNAGMVQNELQRLFKEHKRIDVLVNNAGVAHGGLFQMTPVSDIKRVFEINYFSVIQITQLVSRIMLRKGNGVIVNLASVAGIDLEAGNCAYGASKAALIAFTKTAAKELAKQGIRINAVAPGLTDTRMATQMEKDAGEDMINASAMKRLGRPEEIANAIFFLASDDASFITGQVLRVDGGM